MENKVIFESSYFNRNFYLSISIPIIFYLLFNIGEKEPIDYSTFIFIWLILLLLLVLDGRIGGKVTMTVEALIFHYPARPFSRKLTFNADEIEKVKFSTGDFMDGIELLFKNGVHKRLGNSLTRKEQKAIKQKLEDCGIQVKIW